MADDDAQAFLTSGTVYPNTSGTHCIETHIFSDECIVLTGSTPAHPHAAESAQFAAQTALWGYKQIRTRQFYWDDKPKLVDRIFRSTNIALFQKRRETGFEKGFEASVAVLIVGPKNYWLGSVGAFDAWLYQNRQFTNKAMTTKKILVGVERYGLVPAKIAGQLDAGDTLFVSSGSLTNSQQEAVAAILAGVTSTLGEFHLLRDHIATALQSTATSPVVFGLARRV